MPAEVFCCRPILKREEARLSLLFLKWDDKKKLWLTFGVNSWFLVASLYNEKNRNREFYSHDILNSSNLSEYPVKGY